MASAYAAWDDACSRGIRTTLITVGRLTRSHIRNWTRRDPVLSRVQRYVLTSWPESDQSTQQYHRMRDELSIYDGCIMRGCRIIVPETGRATMLQLLHISHSGVFKMKALALSYIWWPGIDQQNRKHRTTLWAVRRECTSANTGTTSTMALSTKALVTCSHGLCGSARGQDDPDGSICVFQMDRS